MATSTVALGCASKLAFAVEAGAYGTPAASGYRYAYFYKSSLAEKRPIEVDPVIGSGYNNNRDATPPGPSLSEHGGTLELPLCLNGMGDWLKLAFGSPSTSGATNYTHVFNSGALTLPTYTAELNPMASDFRQHVSLALKSLKIDLQDAGGYQRAVLELLGAKENLLSSTGAGTPADVRTYDPMKATGGEVLLGGAAIGVLLGANMTYDTGLTRDRYIEGTGSFNAGLLAEQTSFVGELRVRYNGQTYDTAAVNETDQTLEFRWVKGANNSISFALAAARLGRAGAIIEGPGGLEQTIPFRCAQTSGAPMLAVTLKNQIASY